MEFGIDIKTNKKPLLQKTGGVGRKKKLVIVGVIVVVVVILAGVVFSFWYRNYSKQLSAQKAAAQQATQQEALNKTEQDVSQIIRGGDFSACDSVQDAQYKIVCKNNIAESLANKDLDPKWCLQLDDKMMSQNDCISKIIYAKTIKDTSPDACSLMTQYGYDEASILQCQSSFWTGLAVQKKDAEV